MMPDTFSAKDGEFHLEREETQTQSSRQLSDIRKRRGLSLLSELPVSPKYPMDTAEIVYPPFRILDETPAVEIPQERLRVLLSGIAIPTLLSAIEQYQSEVISLRSENRELRNELMMAERSRVSVFRLPDNYFDEEPEEI